MARASKSLEIGHLPALVRLAEQVRTSGQARILRHEQGDVSVKIRVAPKAHKVRRSWRKTGILTRDDSLFNIIGIAAEPADGVTDVSANKRKYLAEAYEHYKGT